MNFCKITYVFGALAIQNISSRASTAWCTNELLFIILHLPLLIFCFSRSSCAQQIMVKSLIYVNLFRRIFHIPRKIFLKRFFPKAYSIYWSNVFNGTPTRLSGLFWPKKSSTNMVFFRRRKFEHMCITSEFGIFKMCKYFLHILSCFSGFNKKMMVSQCTERGFCKRLGVCGSKPCTKVLGAYVFF